MKLSANEATMGIMHLGLAIKNITLSSVVVFGICFALVEPNFAQEAVGNDGLVEVEINPLIPLDSTGGYYLLPYKYRRRDWGSTVGVSFASFLPDKYDPTYYVDSFSDVYGNQSYGMVEIQTNFKRNFSFFSLGLDAGAGFYLAQAVSGYESRITLIPIHAGIKFSVEAYSLDPFLIPYVAAGGYSVVFTESQSGNSNSGNTQIAPYYSGGLLMQINWLDKQSAIESYIEGGIENTYVFLEGMYLAPSSALEDPDFSNFFLKLGITVEL